MLLIMAAKSISQPEMRIKAAGYIQSLYGHNRTVTSDVPTVLRYAIRVF